MSCQTLVPVCLFRGASMYDFGPRIVDTDGLPVDITAYDFTYTWTRVGDTVAAISWTEADAEVTMGAGTDANQVNVVLAGTDTDIAPGTYCVAYTIDDGAGNVWKAKRLVTIKEMCG